MANEVQIREMVPADRDDVAGLIHHSTNRWYTSAGRPAVFQGEPEATAVFFDVYHTLPGSGGIVAKRNGTPGIVGSCFYHIRPTHISLGIMNAHPGCFGQGVAARLLDWIVAIADRENKPMRLVSSAMNLDSYSLYTKRGFIPRVIYQDMVIAVPNGGLNTQPPLLDAVRPATRDDVDAIRDLERTVAHIQRESDYRHFIDNPEGIWHVSVIDGNHGALAGVMTSCAHPACNMIGPGTARTEAHALALLVAELNRHSSRHPVFLVPAACEPLVKTMYALGARNCELHFSQVRGQWPGVDGLLFPTFLPETA